MDGTIGWGVFWGGRGVQGAVNGMCGGGAVLVPTSMSNLCSLDGKDLFFGGAVIVF